jgi:hypothetical protein
VGIDGVFKVPSNGVYTIFIEPRVFYLQGTKLLPEVLPEFSIPLRLKDNSILYGK